MITEETVFVLGAGASCPYGYPSGAHSAGKIGSDFGLFVSKFFAISQGCQSHLSSKVSGKI